MRIKHILDWSNFTGVPDASDFACLKQDGWEGTILGTQFPDITRQQYAACRANGFYVEALYVFVYWDEKDKVRILAADSLASELNLKVWLDCEWTRTGYPGTGTVAPPPNVIQELIRKYKYMLGDHYKGIYTGRWWWPIYADNTTEFAGDLLWHAEYGDALDEFDTFEPYGGWTRPTIIQYSSAGVDGLVTDLDVEEIPDMPERVWLYGNEQAGLELRGKQQITWNQGVETDALGNYDGSLPGSHWHHAGDNEDGTPNWVKELD